MTGSARIQDFRDRGREAALSGNRLCHNPPMRLLRMKPGHGEVLLAEGDVEVSEELDFCDTEAQLVRSFDEVPRDADRVIFFPQAAGGR